MTAPVIERTVMTPEDRAATEAYLADLQAEFLDNAAGMKAAKSRDDKPAHTRRAERNRDIYREISEVKVALRTGLMPF